MALRKVKATVEQVLEKNLQDLVRGIRNNKENEAKYISQCIEDIKQELKTDNVAVKAVAINKLIYLEMLGYDISWAAFNIIEVMSSPKFTFKRVGYLAAAQSFHSGTDVLMLTTNMIRKDLCSSQLYDVGVTLSGLSCFMSPDLARDLANDVMTLMTSSKPYVRKKAILLMYKVFLCYPDALRVAFPRLKERLEDSDPGVQAAAVNVIGELARKNPRNYLSLAPVFFKLMTTSTSNWVLIKIIKLFAALTPLEPRLGKKLIEPLTNLIHSTSAMSLLYECINTVIAVLISITSAPGVTESAQTSAVQTQLANLCVQKLRILIEDSDQNLKYLGLLAMSRILTTHPKSVQAHKDLILNCLDDKDESIRLRALDLLYGMISKKTLMEIVKKLLMHADKAEGAFYRDELLAKVIDICSQNNYQYVTNFEWYVSVLVDLTRVESTRHGALIAAQMLDVAIRVPSVRAFAVSQMAVLVENAHLVVGVSSQAQSVGGICEVFYAAVFLCAEFSDYLKEPAKTLTAMLRPKVAIFPGHVQSVFVHNACKLWVKLVVNAVSERDAATFAELTRQVRDRLSQLVQNADLEVQERASVFDQLVRAVEKLATVAPAERDSDAGSDDEGAEAQPLPSQELADELAALFSGELNPVAPKAQKKVPVPEGLDLDSWINEPPQQPVPKSTFDFASSSKQSSPTFSGVASKTSTNSPLTEFADHSATSFGSSFVSVSGTSTSISTSKRPEPTNEELQRMREQRLIEQQANPNYLKPGSKPTSSLPAPDSLVSSTSVTTSDVPSTGREIVGLVSSDKFLQEQRRSVLEEEEAQRKPTKRTKGTKGKKKQRKADLARQREPSESEPAVVVLTTFDIPEGVSAAEPEDSNSRVAPSLQVDDPHRALAEVNLDEPLKAGEHRLPDRQHRSESTRAEVDAYKLKPVYSEKNASAPQTLSPITENTEKAKSESDKKAKKPTAGTKKRSKKAQSQPEEPIIQFDEPAELPQNAPAVSTETTGQANSSTGKVNAVADTNGQSKVAAQSQEQAATQKDVINEQQSTNINSTTSTKEQTTKKTTKEQPSEKQGAKDDKSVKKDSTKKEQTRKTKRTDTSPSPKKRSAKKKDGVTAESARSGSKRQPGGDHDRNEYEQTFDDLLRPDDQLFNMQQAQSQSNTVVAQLLGQTRSTPSTAKFSSYKLLAENASLKLMYQIRVQRTEPQQFTLALGFVNKTSNGSTLRRFDFNVLDTMNTKLCRSAGADKYDAVSLAFQLAGGSTQDCQFTFTIESISVAQKLRGSVSYLVVPPAASPTDSASSVSSSSEKLDFVLMLPCSAFLFAADHTDSDQFAALLTSGDLSAKYTASIKLNGRIELPFSALLDRVTNTFRLQLVECVDTSASLFGRTIQSQDVCILLKYASASNTVTIDAKAADGSLISSLVDELKSDLAKFSAGTQF